MAAIAERTGRLLKLARGKSGVTPWEAYLAALVVVAIALLVRLLLGPVLGELPLLVLFVPAVLAASLLGGLGPGLFATALSLFGSVAFVASASWATAPNLIADAVFAFVGIGIAWFGAGCA